MEKIIFGFITSFFVVLLATPALIKMAKIKHIVDEPSEDRKRHRKSIPTIGGIILFAGTVLSFTLWFPFKEINDYDKMANAVNDFQYLLASLIILFFVGVKDDIIGTSPVKKLVAHIAVAFILVVAGDVRIESMHGIFWVQDLPYAASLFLSAFAYIVIVNAFNLIDGVDGLAAGVGVVGALAFGVWFSLVGNLSLAMLAFVLSGSLLAFLIFNFSPAKIFMGDSGSLTLGVIMSVLAIQAIETDAEMIPENLRHISTPVFAMAALAYPLIDTLRVFLYRAVKGLSPFSADRNHIHHKLLNIGLSHGWCAVTIYIFNAVLIALAVLLPIEEPTIVMGVVAGSAIALVQLLFMIKSKPEGK